MKTVIITLCLFCIMPVIGYSQDIKPDYEHVTSSVTIRQSNPDHPDWSELPFGEPNYYKPICSVPSPVKGSWTYWPCYGYSQRPSDSYLKGHEADIFGRSYRHTVTKSFILLALSEVSSAVADAEYTQYRLHNSAGYFREGNPLMGSTRAQEYGVSMSLATLVTFLSWEQKRRVELGQSVGYPYHWYTKMWYEPMMAVTAMHIVGIVGSSRAHTQVSPQESMPTPINNIRTCLANPPQVVFCQ